MSHTYRAYGLRLRSALPLPPLATTTEAGDATIRFGPVLKQASAAPRRDGCFEANEKHIFLFYQQAGAFLIKNGRDIVAEPAEEADDDALRAVILGPALGLLLHQRGLLPLHASAVSIRDGAVAFAGNKGYGKSTTAAALHRRGHPLVTDDVLAAHFGEESAGDTSIDSAPVVFPGFAQIKLWPDAVSAALDHTPDTLPHLYGRHDKRAWRGGPELAQRTLPLRALYVLDYGDAFATHLLRPRIAFPHIVRHTYAAQLTPVTGRAPLHLRQCTALVQHIPIYRLERPRSLAALPDFARFIEQHVQSTL